MLIILMALATLVVLALPVGAYVMRKHTRYYAHPVVRTVVGGKILGAAYAPTYATLTAMAEPDSWRLEIKPPHGKAYRFLIGPQDDIKPIKKDDCLGKHSNPWQSHDTHHTNFGTAVDVLPNTKLEMVLIYEDENGTPTRLDLLFLFGSQIRVSFMLSP